MYMDAENIQVWFANVLWVAFSVPSSSVTLVKYPVLIVKFVEYFIIQ
jgi:hypothetical protein